MTVRDIFSQPAVTAEPSETVIDAARRMRAEHVGDLVVVSPEGRPVGMLTDRDIVVSAVAQSSDRLDRLTVGDVMSRDVVTVHVSDPLDAAVTKMRARGVRRLPVVSADGRTKGIVALDDVLRVMFLELGNLVGVTVQAQKAEWLARR
jgi:CBS domain-containing protein